ncbi:MAG: hypothetical protein Q9216_005283 [Gyalolechia sp. 2 TL-2023]
MAESAKDEFYHILKSQTARTLFNFDDDKPSRSLTGFEYGWMIAIAGKVYGLLGHGDDRVNEAMRKELYQIGVTALDAFLQSNVTGPPLAWNSAELLFPPEISKSAERLRKIRWILTLDLSVDGEAVHKLIPNVELFCLAKALLNDERLFGPGRLPLQYRWARVTVNFWHQKMLNENTASLQESIYQDLDSLEEDLRCQKSEEKARRLVQRATIHTQHGFDQRAREDLGQAAKESGFQYKLTGRLGKRTKFQEKDLSQLVVLAKSADPVRGENASISDAQVNGSDSDLKDASEAKSKPQNLDLNDDTLLESIEFSNSPSQPAEEKEGDISPSLAALDPTDQPLLQPLDSIILLAYASSITNTSPSDGLTREETLPYAFRVLQQGSSNWQIYTQALLVRSRIEGHKSRTVERSVLQLQALVDQVIVETGGREDVDGQKENSAPSSFLPKPSWSDSAPASERLQYIHQLASPTRWELEAELASRWVSLGALRTALEIYQRLHMWAEVALCWAASDREDKARKIVRQQLYMPANETWSEENLEHKWSIDDDDLNIDDWTQEQYPFPADAARLWCILGDLENSPSAYERAWEVYRYPRAQRSLGKYYFKQGDLKKADEAYSKSLKVNALNHSTWFSLGCVRLQLEDWAGAVDAFGRAIQIEDQDAESWSNMAAALLQMPAEVSVNGTDQNKATKHDTSTEATTTDDEDISTANIPPPDPQKHIKEAFTALKRAAALKHDSHRIWQNLLNVSVKLSPPPYTDIIIAQTRLIDLRSKSEGEQCVDVEVMEGLVAHLIAISPSPTDNIDKNPPLESSDSKTKPGFQRLLLTLIQTRIVPLTTTSRRLHLLVAKLSLHLQKPLATLQAYEKAWRVTLNRPGWEEAGTRGAEGLWMEVVDATGELVDAYESLGERRREEAEGKEEGGEGGQEGKSEWEMMVAKDWRFKARAAVRSVLGRAKEGWEGRSEGYERLRGRLEDLKGL